MSTQIVLLGDIIAGISSNLFCIVFFIIALSRAKANKSFWMLFAVGIILQLVSFAGGITEAAIEPDITISREEIFAFVFFGIFVLAEIILLKRKSKKIVKLKENDK